jgi:methanogenic corrinoid protein MtbC1
MRSMRSTRADEARMETEGMPIGDVSDLLGVPIPTLRSWERRYGVPEPPRTGGGHRRYSMAEVDQIRTLRDEVSRGLAAREAAGVVRRLFNVDPGTGAAIDRFADAARAMDPGAIRNILDGALHDLGVDRSIIQVAFPAMRHLGALWESGNCDVAAEHIATEAVRSWLSRLALIAPPRWRPPVLLACSPKELHSLGLEAFGVVLAHRGWECRTLGANSPANSIVTATIASGSVGVVVAAQRAATRRPATLAIGDAARLPGVTVFYAGGAFAPAGARRGVPGVYLGDDLVEAAEIIRHTIDPSPGPGRPPIGRRHRDEGSRKERTTDGHPA